MALKPLGIHDSYVHVIHANSEIFSPFTEEVERHGLKRNIRLDKKDTDFIQSVEVLEARNVYPFDSTTESAELLIRFSFSRQSNPDSHLCSSNNLRRVYLASIAPLD